MTATTDDRPRLRLPHGRQALDDHLTFDHDVRRVYGRPDRTELEAAHHDRHCGPEADTRRPRHVHDFTRWGRGVR